MKSLSEAALKGLRDPDPEFAEALADEFLNAWIARQIRTLRDDRGWKQSDLASRAGMKQSRISALENINYSSWSVKTLKRIAHACGVTLAVEFRGYGKRLYDFDRFEAGLLHEPSRLNDPIVDVHSGEQAPVSSDSSSSTALLQLTRETSESKRPLGRLIERSGGQLFVETDQSVPTWRKIHA